MTDFPTLLYRIPGMHRLNGSQTFDYIGAKDDVEYAKHVNDGWSHSIDAALGGEAEDIIAEPVSVVADEPIPEPVPEPVVEQAAEGIEEPVVEPVLAEQVAEPEDPRAALEAQAKELGIGFNSRTADEVLAERIAAKGSEE